MTDKEKIKVEIERLKESGCAISKDIGQYNTCVHLCEYCYANASKEAARSNYKRHLSNPDGECIVME